tara:strand:+ start:4897 stop:5673 length:777 start_codon:yes stop_codon:yes gene_type:complete
MAKYQSNEIATLENELATPTPQNAATPAPPLPDEQGTFKKRYGDLRKHLQTTVDQKDKEIEDLRDQLENATKQQLKFPKTDEEIAQWAAKYPQVADIVDSIASKRANEALEIGEKRIENLEKLEAKITKQNAEKELRSLHPDFDRIRESAVFHDWVGLQPQWVQDALYKNTTDARAASRAIDLYKIDKGMKRRPASSGTAAAAISRGGAAAPSGAGQARFSESQVEKMSPQDYEKNEAAILDAMKKGNFVYDVSGAAR